MLRAQGCLEAGKTNSINGLPEDSRHESGGRYFAKAIAGQGNRIVGLSLGLGEFLQLCVFAVIMSLAPVPRNYDGTLSGWILNIIADSLLATQGFMRAV